MTKEKQGDQNVPEDQSQETAGGALDLLGDPSRRTFLKRAAVGGAAASGAAEVSQV